MSNLERLKEFYKPKETINVIEQARMVSTALGVDGSYAGRIKELAEYLGISQSQTSKLNNIINRLLPEVIEYFEQSDYQVSMAYNVGQLNPMAQLSWLEDMKIAEG